MKGHTRLNPDWSLVLDMGTSNSPKNRAARGVPWHSPMMRRTEWLLNMALA